eukprot:12067667-Alexandrium_andersonii.AAC.1
MAMRNVRRNSARRPSLRALPGWKSYEQFQFLFTAYAHHGRQGTGLLASQRLSSQVVGGAVSQRW